MIRFIRSFRFKTGGEVWLNLVRDMRTLLEKYTGVKWVVYFSRFGEIAKIFWTADYESLTAYAEIIDKFNKNDQAVKEYNEISDKMQEFTVHGTTYDQILTVFD